MQLLMGRPLGDWRADRYVPGLTQLHTGKIVLWLRPTLRYEAVPYQRQPTGAGQSGHPHRHQEKLHDHH